MAPPRVIPRHPSRRPALACLVASLVGAGLGWLSVARPSAPSADPAAPARASTIHHDATGATTAPPAVAPWAERWENTTALASTPARTRALAALLETLARTDPERALSLARAQSDWRLRDLLRDAALRGWASVAPEAAGDWALAARPEDRRAVVAAVLQGACADPAAAVRLALRLCASDPEPAGDYGHAAIAALIDAGAFAQAADFGARVGVEKHPFLLKSAYFEWARHQPAAALAATEGIADPLLAGQARAQVISGWAWADAAGLAGHALKLPAGPERAQALAEALPLWLERQPDEAAAWLQKHDSGADFDAGLAALANQPDFLAARPAAALDLATDIADPARRTETIRSVFRQWALRDPLSARAYAETSAPPADRAALAAILADLSPDPRP